MIAMKPPAHKTQGAQRLEVNEQQARILRAVGWTEIQENQEIGPPTVVNEQNFFRGPKPKRKYTRKAPDEKSEKRRYRRRDMQAEDDQ